MGCDKNYSSYLCINKNFNPRTHVGCDTSRSRRPSGAGYFNPRTHVGCDLSISTIVLFISNFNPRTHVGCDYYGRRLQYSVQAISIHAPTWGATLRSGGRQKKRVISIHAPTWGATGHYFDFREKTVYFNPRTHVGCDPLHASVGAGHRISIHAPTWGATSEC